MKHRSQFLVVKPRPLATSRLFCFPHAGGGPVIFFDWPKLLGPEIECVSLQSAGRGYRLQEEPLTSVEHLVAEIADDFSSFTDKPFAFYGHSFGGILAFELTRQLRRMDLPRPHHLFVAASRPPQLELPYAPIHQLADRDFVESLQARYGGIPLAIYRDPDLLEMFLPAMRADFTAYETYRFHPDEPIDIPITAFAGAEDAAIRVDSLEQWAVHTAREFELHVLPGGHFFPATCAAELTRAMEISIAADLNERKTTFVR